MVDEGFIRNLGIIITAAAVFAMATRQLRVPTIVGYLLAGVFLGPITHLVANAEAVSLISEVGIVLLLFLVGLELDFAKIRDLGKVALLSGLGQIGLTLLLGLGCCLLLGFPFQTALVMGAALTFSSTVVVVKVLTERKELGNVHGRIGIGVLLVQDLVAILQGNSTNIESILPLRHRQLGGSFLVGYGHEHDQGSRGDGRASGRGPRRVTVRLVEATELGDYLPRDAFHLESDVVFHSG